MGYIGVGVPCKVLVNAGMFLGRTVQGGNHMLSEVPENTLCVMFPI